jgi:alpha-L-fucosidase
MNINFLSKSIVLFFSLIGTINTNAQLPKETEEAKIKRLEWWQDARFGMFCHWGLYAMPARHEWVKKNEKLTNEDYQKYFENFNPDLFNPKEWARMAKEAGMKYFVITTKHHEGFCMFDSRYTDYKITNTPYKKDILKEVVDAFRAEGIHIGFYYSLLDWHHPDYIVDRNHPQRPLTEPGYDSINKGRDMNKYRQYVKNQVGELLTNYGKIDILWLDYSFPKNPHGKNRNDWDSENLLKMVRELQPQVIVNDRLDLLDMEGGWDFTTPEQSMVSKCPERNGRKIPWETCQTFSDSWGYYRDEASWKSTNQLLQILIESVSKGGNLLLNVGPTARGTFDYRAQERLKEIGTWMKVNERSIRGCTQAPDEFPAQVNCIMTYNPSTKRLYLHLLNWPVEQLTLKGFGGKVKYAQFLYDASEVKFSKPKKSITYQEEENKNDLILELPINKPQMEIPVIELFLN